jgi:hypothetical protein
MLCVCSAGRAALRVHSRCTAPAVPGRSRARGVRTCGHCMRSACVVQVGEHCVCTAGAQPLQCPDDAELGECARAGTA